MSWRQGLACSQDLRDKMMAAFDAGEDQHDPPARPRCQGCALGRRGAARPLAHQQLSGRARHDRMVAPAVFDSAINGRSFRAYVERALAPALSSGDVVVLDTLGSHKVRGASLRYLPPYSPDLNPIEQAFAKLKQLIRAAAPRACETLWRSIGTMLDRFKPNECANYLANPAYPRSA